MIQKLGPILLILILTSCHPQVDSFDNTFKLSERILYKDQKLFSGKLRRFNGQIEKIIEYKNGLKQGVERHFYPSGILFKEQFYREGKPIGNHREWFKNGKKKRLTQFKNGQHHGDYIHWYDNGQVYIYTKYDNGQIQGHKLWRKNGRIYANYVYKNGKRLGLTGGKLCFSAEDEE